MKCRLKTENHGSIILIVPVGRAALRWLREHVASEPWQWLGTKLAVEPRLASDILNGWESR